MLSGLNSIPVAFLILLLSNLFVSDAALADTLSIDPVSGETHRRHHITKDGYYRGRQVVVPKQETLADEE